MDNNHNYEAGRNDIKKKIGEPKKTDISKLESVDRYSFVWPQLPEQLKEGLYSFEHGHYEYDFLFTSSTEKRLFVLLSGDADRERFTPPVFQRWSWAKNFPGNCLYISDPVLKLHKEVGLGWYLGIMEQEILPTLAELIQDIVDKIGIKTKNVIIYASSGGGFAALQLAKLLPEVITVAINPQTDLASYKNRRVDKFLDLFYHGMDRKEALINFPNRFSILPESNKLLESRILYVQNKLDSHHMNVQFKLFSERLGLNESNGFAKNGIETMFFEHPDGHKKAETAEVFHILMSKVLEMTN